MKGRTLTEMMQMDPKSWSEFKQQHQPASEPPAKRQKFQQPQLAPRDIIAKDFLHSVLVQEVVSVVLEYLGACSMARATNTIPLLNGAHPKSVFLDRSELLVLTTDGLLVSKYQSVSVPRDVHSIWIDADGHCYVVKIGGFAQPGTLYRYESPDMKTMTHERDIPAAWLIFDGGRLVAVDQGELWMQHFRGMVVYNASSLTRKREVSVEFSCHNSLVCVVGDVLYVATKNGRCVYCFDKQSGNALGRREIGGTISGLVAGKDELFVSDRDNMIKVLAANKDLPELRRFSPGSNHPQVMCFDGEKVYVYCPELNCIRVFFS